MKTSSLACAFVMLGCLPWAACSQYDAHPGGKPAIPAGDDQSSECDSRIWTGDYTVQSQAELDALARYTMVTGSVIISESDLASVDGPPCLEVITGDLIMIDNSDLTRVSGFDGLRIVGSLQFFRNGNYFGGNRMHVYGFDALHTITGNAIFSEDHVIHGFASLERIAGDLRFRTGSVDVRGMNELRVVGSMGFVDCSPVILDGLHALEIVIGNLRFAETGPELYTAGMRSLSTVGGDIRFTEAAVTRHALAGFDSLITVGGSLRLTYSGLYTELGGFAALQALGGIVIWDTLGSGRITGFPALRSLGYFLVHGSGVSEIAGFPALEHIAGGVEVSSNSSLGRIALDGLTSISGNLSIDSNYELDELRLPALESLGGNFTVTRNFNLPTCQAEAILAELRAHGHTGAAIIDGNGTGDCDQ